MNAREVIARFRMMGPQDPNVTYSFLADHAREFTLMSGDYLHEPREWSLFFRELAVESHTIPCFDECSAEPGKRRPAAQRRWDEFCPDCGHIHIEDGECAFPTGGGRICRCERSASA